MREYGPGNPLVFSHIPKTAGTSLRVALERALRPEVVAQGTDLALVNGYYDMERLTPRIRSGFYFGPEEMPADATLVAGHVSPSTTMARYPGADHITVLRVPQVRGISHFLHTRSLTKLQLRHWGSSINDFARVGYLSLRDYLDDPTIAAISDNTITRFLTWPHPLAKQTEFIAEEHDDELLAAAIDRLDQFAFVNVTENPGMFAELGAWLGAELVSERLNERTAVPRWRRPDLLGELDAGTRARLDHRSRVDVRLWEHVARRVLPGTDVLELLRTVTEQSFERYAAMLREPDQGNPLRRAVERVYDLRGRR